MKRRMWAPLLAAALAVGPMGLAADWVLPSGEVLPMGDKVVVWNAHDGYLGEAADAFLADPYFAREISKGFLEESGLFEKNEKKGADALGTAVMDVLRRSRVYQLRTTEGDVMHTAIAVSIPCDLKLTDAEKQDILTRAAAKTMEVEGNGEILDAVKDYDAAIKETSEKSGKSHGVSYKSGKIVMTPKYEKMKMPLFLYWMSTTKNDKETVTFVFANQTAGKIFEPLLNRAVGDMR